MQAGYSYKCVLFYRVVEVKKKVISFVLAHKLYFMMMPLIFFIIKLLGIVASAANVEKVMTSVMRPLGV